MHEPSLKQTADNTFVKNFTTVSKALILNNLKSKIS